MFTIRAGARHSDGTTLLVYACRHCYWFAAYAQPEAERRAWTHIKMCPNVSLIERIVETWAHGAYNACCGDNASGFAGGMRAALDLMPDVFIPEDMWRRVSDRENEIYEAYEKYHEKCKEGTA